ncbi:MAG: 2-C-methyl-D-erythritol 2,4-cyclodiphosphate synthase [Bacteroidia bacterium]|nr:2-C-methyl-D-erythritol 2,4-cyclodiphosphate synthase [Bacteroidia bacterium]MCX7764447.1 2-C-methyl-D-erythritol 2,4-cyclodiphosphate synthase [Bacteroidia bacterium]MDW8057310.1 2-C-methyl-D-erythritol 2,4-cyclodiphosphate synthase [Bacteroidia bacterium]
MRIGLGYDAHKFTEGRLLRIGGVTIPYERGLAGHSDADVLLHAICDALLGAAGEGDIGQHFPPSDPKYKDIDSRLLLEKVREIITKAGWLIVNIDAVVIAQAPKLSPYYAQMRHSIAQVLQVSLEQVSIKATTPEGMGALGRLEGIAAYAVALLIRQ